LKFSINLSIEGVHPLNDMVALQAMGAGSPNMHRNGKFKEPPSPGMGDIRVLSDKGDFFLPTGDGVAEKGQSISTKVAHEDAGEGQEKHEPVEPS